jgi:hypothetical protein
VLRIHHEARTFSPPGWLPHARIVPGALGARSGFHDRDMDDRRVHDFHDVGKRGAPNRVLARNARQPWGAAASGQEPEKTAQGPDECHRDQSRRARHQTRV